MGPFRHPREGGDPGLHRGMTLKSLDSRFRGDDGIGVREVIAPARNQNGGPEGPPFGSSRLAPQLRPPRACRGGRAGCGSRPSAALRCRSRPR
ncbi:hypothetical protein DX914_10395 [Lysobacter silvisoli]|uniref:Uncharacterized protein n=1 Tax=Lysobacter silvisoli TaxID=2293254 RepID=A0A371K6H7_9GAMM|nr:hypothetical protein DX914_10395 [Lysobacter silvisoli]